MYLCVSMSQIMKHHGCRSHMMNQNNLTGQEDRFDLVVDSNDAILERVVRSANLIQSFCEGAGVLFNAAELLCLISRGFCSMKLTV